MDLSRGGKAVPRHELRGNGNEKRGSAVAGTRPGLRRNGEDEIGQGLRCNGKDMTSEAL